MVKEEKLKAVEELKKLLEEYPVIGILDMYKHPSKQLQEIRKKLRGKAIIKVTKKSILVRAIRSVNKEKLSELEKFIPSQPAILFTNSEPLKFYLFLNTLKPTAFAREGDVVEEDITVHAGPTSLLPGPVISELSKVGLVAGVEGGKIVIKKDKVVAKRGDKISKELASVLRKLKIETIKVGLNVVVFFDNGEIYTKEVLTLVGENYLNRIKQAFSEALNLSVAIGYPTKENVSYLFMKAYQIAKAIENKIGGVK